MPFNDIAARMIQLAPDIESLTLVLLAMPKDPQEESHQLCDEILMRALMIQAIKLQTIDEVDSLLKAYLDIKKWYA